MAYNATPNRISGFSPYELMFGRTPPIPTTQDIDAAVATTDIDRYSHLLTIQKALKDAHEHTYQSKTARNILIAKRYNRCRQPLDLNVNDFVYVYQAYNAKSRKLTAQACGPFRVTEVCKHPHTNQVTGATVDIGTPGRPLHRRYPRYRLRPLHHRHPLVDWEGIGQEAVNRRNDLRGESIDFPLMDDSALDRYHSDDCLNELPENAPLV